MSWLTLVALAAGLALLVGGAEALVRGAARLAGRFGISPLVIGLTVVAFGTSAPETAVGIGAVLGGSDALGVGSVVGSNIANILLILGLSALVAPLAVSRQLVRLDVPLLILAGLIVYAMAWDGRIVRLEGLGLLVALLAYTTFLVVAGRREAKAEPGRPSPAHRTRALADALWVALGLALLVLGSDLLIDSAQVLARAFGLSELVIGLTVVAVGTSLPELATSLMAVVRGERDIAVGNVIGSCLFNLLLVLGGTALVGADGLAVPDGARAFDLPVMLAAFLACLPIFLSGYCINRWEGLLFFSYYLAYTAYLVMFATDRPALDLFRQGMGWFVLPLTGVTLAVVLYRTLRRPSPDSRS